MTIQQMEYIVAVNQHRHFVTASERCGVTQPTLSTMIQRLEEELGAKIFDRSKQPIEPTPIGVRIIQQAERSLLEIKKIKEMVVNEIGTLSGVLRVGIIPTLAPYLLPDFLRLFPKDYPNIDFSVAEMRTQTAIGEILKGNIDLMIAATPLNNAELYEIPIYYERFVAYFSADNPDIDTPLSADSMPPEQLWVLHEGHCIRNQTFNFCRNFNTYNKSYEAGSIDTLVRIVDKNGGYSVIPELHVPCMSAKQQANIRSVDNPPAVREVSLIIRKDFIKERLLNAVADTIKKIVPTEMLDERLKKFSIKL